MEPKILIEREDLLDLHGIDVYFRDDEGMLDHMPDIIIGMRVIIVNLAERIKKLEKRQAVPRLRNNRPTTPRFNGSPYDLSWRKKPGFIK